MEDVSQQLANGNELGRGSREQGVPGWGYRRDFWKEAVMMIEN